MVFQHHNLFINKNAIENVAEALIVVKKMPKKQAFELAYEKLELVGLKDKLYSYAFELSGGQAQRVGIARALAVNPSLMLFDEPTSALDAELVGEVLEVIKNIKDQSMLIVTHELNFAKSVADEIVFMSEGEILEQSLTQDFFKKPKHPRVKQFLARFDNEDFCI
ncbi:amino acid ABC transporter ATP-binding protein [Campylobacter sp. MIT 97-5078]|nr:ATP-binding cassette domain-containing protein [Campylobacter sp. MIT 97-5078]TQR26729.1 amino acid ABC transporter ATP-binding protein [Campylobacter sp. MIT 97-5078]